MEALEQMPLRFSPDADAGILDFEPHAPHRITIVGDGQTHLDTALVGEFDRIADEIEQSLPQADRVGHDPPVVAAHHRAQFQAFFHGQGAQHARNALQGVRHVEGLWRQLQPPSLDL